MGLPVVGGDWIRFDSLPTHLSSNSQSVARLQIWRSFSNQSGRRVHIPWIFAYCSEAWAGCLELILADGWESNWGCRPDSWQWVSAHGLGFSQQVARFQRKHSKNEYTKRPRQRLENFWWLISEVPEHHFYHVILVKQIMRGEELDSTSQRQESERMCGHFSPLQGCWDAFHMMGVVTSTSATPFFTPHSRKCDTHRCNHKINARPLLWPESNNCYHIKSLDFSWCVRKVGFS